jgi:hypothetical protein
MYHKKQRKKTKYHHLSNYDTPWAMSAFHHCNRILKVNNLKGGRIYFGLQPYRFQPWSLGSIAFGPLVRKNIVINHMAEEV